MTKRERRDWLFLNACLAASIVASVLLMVVLGAIIFKVAHGVSSLATDSSPPPSWRQFLASLVSQTPSSDPAQAGFRAGLQGSLWLLVLVGGFSAPVAVGAALFLEEYRLLPEWLRRLIQLNIANLAAIPAILYGMLGLTVFRHALGTPQWGSNSALIVAALTLSLLIIPVMTLSIQEVLRSVPSSQKIAAIALGATHWQVIRDHVLPTTFPSIITSVILSLSRAVGETAPLLMIGAAASVFPSPHLLAQPYSAVPVEIFHYARQPAEPFQTVAAGGILILLALLFSMNALAFSIQRRWRPIPIPNDSSL